MMNCSLVFWMGVVVGVLGVVRANGGWMGAEWGEVGKRWEADTRYKICQCF